MPQVPSIAAAAESFFRARFESHADAERARKEKAYMKSELAFHGVTSTVVHASVREWAKAHPEVTRAQLHAIARHLFDTGWFDLRSAAIGVLERFVERLGEDDLDPLIALVRRAGCWAHVDWLATKIIGPIATASAHRSAHLRGWAGDADFWVRRTALLAQHDALKRGQGDLDLFLELAEGMLEEKEFFIRKAIGWILREVSKKNPKPVAAFVKRHDARMSGVTRREAVKSLP